MRNRLIIVSILLITLLINVRNTFEIDVNAGLTSRHSVLIEEEFFHQVSFDFERRCYLENQTRHSLHVVAHDLTDEEHNLTLFCDKGEEIVSSDPLNGIIFSTNNSNYISFLFSGEVFDGHVYLENTRFFSEPTITILPSDTDILSVNDDNLLELDLVLESSEKLDIMDLEIGYYNMEEIIDYEVESPLELISDYIHNGRIKLSFSDVPEGINFIHLTIVVGKVEGGFPLVFDCFQSRNSTFLIQAELDGEIIEFDSRVRCKKNTTNIRYLRAKKPELFGFSNPQIYNITFLCNESLVFRVDPDSRERIEFLAVDGEIIDFNTKEITYEGHDAIIFTLDLVSPTTVSLGVKLYDKTWFLRPSIMESEKIPQEIMDEYTYPSRFIDTDNELVKLWSEQIIKNETNPLIVASTLYLNLSQELVYNDTYSEFNEANETASATLRNGAGVCRHFARTFAALAILGGIPAKVIVGTAFNLRSPVTELKKNHSWNEIFLPRFGWIPVDITWGNFGLLPNTHAMISYWAYIKDEINITRIDNETSKAQRARTSQKTLEGLIQICETNVDKLSNHQKEFVIVMLEQARLFTDSGNIQEAILALAEIDQLILINQPRSDSWLAILATATAIILSLVLLGIKIRNSRQHTREGY